MNLRVLFETDTVSVDFDVDVKPVMPSLLCTYPFAPTHFTTIILPTGHPVGRTIGLDVDMLVLDVMYTSSSDFGGSVVWFEDICTL